MQELLRERGAGREREEGKERVLKDLLGRVRKRGGVRGAFAAKHSRSVDGKRTTIWSLCSTSSAAVLNTPSP